MARRPDSVEWINPIVWFGILGLIVFAIDQDFSLPFSVNLCCNLLIVGFLFSILMFILDSKHEKRIELTNKEQIERDKISAKAKDQQDLLEWHTKLEKAKRYRPYISDEVFQKLMSWSPEMQEVWRWHSRLDLLDRVKLEKKELNKKKKQGESDRMALEKKKRTEERARTKRIKQWARKEITIEKIHDKKMESQGKLPRMSGTLTRIEGIGGGKRFTSSEQNDLLSWYMKNQDLFDEKHPY